MIEKEDEALHQASAIKNQKAKDWQMLGGTGDGRAGNKGRLVTKALLDNFRRDYPTQYDHIGRLLIKRERLQDPVARTKVNEQIYDYIQDVRNGKK